MVLLFIRGQQHQEFKWFGSDKAIMGSSFLSSPSRLSLSRIHSLPVTAPTPFSSRSRSQLFPGSSVGKQSACIEGDPGSIPGSGRSPGEGIGYPLQYSWASLGGSDGKEPACQCGRPGFNPWLGTIPWRREWLPIPVFWPGEFHRRGDWQATVHGVSKSQTRLSDLHTLDPSWLS